MSSVKQPIESLNKNRATKRALITTSIIIPFIIAAWPVLSGNITLWYDNARDLLSAWDNLSKLTLIGPTSGIPGIFYGPYWIWLLSLGLLVSKDPAITTFIVATLPYFIIFPLIWFRFGKFFGLQALITGWSLFIFSSGIQYATKLWNPYPAPLLAIGAIYLLLTIDFKKSSRATGLQSFLLGFLLGLIINFHTSFGIGFNLGVALFLMLTFLKSLSLKGKWLLSFCIIGTGFLISFIPFILFEIRHGFNQIQVIINTASSYGGTIGMKGLTHMQIFQEFIGTFAKLIHLPSTIAETILITATGLFILLLRYRRIYLTKNDTKIIALIFCLFTGISFIYFTAKNPVWAYHFIGVDILFLLVIVFLMTKLSLLRKGLTIFTIYIVVANIYSFIPSVATQQAPPFHHQKELVTTISQDAGKSDYVVMAYSPSIYIYEYTYLFKWLAKKNVPYDPSQNASSKVIYLIIPPKMDEKVEDFIHFRSPDSIYRTERQWDMHGENTIIKKVKK